MSETLTVLRMAYSRLSKVEPVPLDELTALANEIERLEKVEPVAWNGGKAGREWTTDRAVAESWLTTSNQQAVPLYTHPEPAIHEEIERLHDEIAYLLREMRRAQDLMLREVGIGFIDPRIFTRYELQDTHGTCGSKTSVPAEVLHTEQAESPLTNVPNSHPAPAIPEGWQKDAERYRYLRHASRRECLDKNGPEAGCWIDCEDENHTLILLTEEDADKAIDAAMAKMEELTK